MTGPATQQRTDHAARLAGDARRARADQAEQDGHEGTYAKDQADDQQDQNLWVSAQEIDDRPHVRDGAMATPRGPT